MEFDWQHSYGTGTSDCLEILYFGLEPIEDWNRLQPWNCCHWSATNRGNDSDPTAVADCLDPAILARKQAIDRDYSDPTQIADLLGRADLVRKSVDRAGTIPIQLESMTDLVELNLYLDHQLTGTIPRQLGSLTAALTALLLFKNRYTGRNHSDPTGNVDFLGRAELARTQPIDRDSHPTRIINCRDIPELAPNHLTGTIPI